MPDGSGLCLDMDNNGQGTWFTDYDFDNDEVACKDITYYYICRENSLSHYQRRNSITKEEILRNVQTIDHLKVTSSSSQNKVYYPNRCLNIILTDFYIACHVIKRRKNIVPSFSNDEIKAIMTHPATLRQICSFRQSRLKNLFFYLLGRLPSSLCVGTIWMMGKAKKLL